MNFQKWELFSGSPGSLPATKVSGFRKMRSLAEAFTVPRFTSKIADNGFWVAGLEDCPCKLHHLMFADGPVIYWSL